MHQKASYGDIPIEGFFCHGSFGRKCQKNIRVGHEFRFEIHALFCYPLAEGMINMKFTSISQSNIDELCIAFESCLTKHDITFKYVDMTEDNGIISFIFCDDPENARSVDMESERFIGLDTDYIAKEILEPILPKLKEFAQYKIID
jgi:hypothetical protein